jgi:hypothetical protein
MIKKIKAGTRFILRTFANVLLASIGACAVLQTFFHMPPSPAGMMLGSTAVVTGLTCLYFKV